MSKNVDGGMSMRSGALILKTISIFLASSRNAKSLANQPQAIKSKVTKSKRMNDKDNNKSKISSRLLEVIKRDTHFSRNEIETLYKIYKKMISTNKLKPNFDQSSNNSGASIIIRKSNSIHEGINRTTCCELLHNTFGIITEDIIIDRIFCVLDKENLGTITMHNWFLGLSTFLRGTFLEQIHFCFSVYDLNADGFITKDEMFQLLKNCLVKHPQEEDPDESVKELVEIVMKKMDIDKDGKVSLEDYEKSVNEEPLLMEAFGICLPTDNAKETFLSTLKT